MSFGGGWRPHLESALSLGIPALGKHGLLKAGSWSGTWTWSRDGEQTASIGYRTQIDDLHGTMWLVYSAPDRETGEKKQFDYPITLESTKPHFGGFRWWFRCPYTHRRVAKLYKFNGIEKFCARTAIRPKPTYASQRVSGHDRVLARQWAIRRKLNDPGCLLDPLMKPKWMRWKTFQKWDELNSRLDLMDAGYIMRRFGMSY
jgi:hypothetical protein